MKKIFLALVILFFIEIVAIFCYYFFYLDMLPASMENVVSEENTVSL